MCVPAVHASTDTAGAIERFIRLSGFLKYYHPAFTEGRLDWDDVFVKNYAVVKDLPGTEQSTQFFRQWIDTLGGGLKRHPVTRTGNRHPERDVSSLASIRGLVGDIPELQDALRRRTAGTGSFYASKNKLVGHAEFLNERRYDSMQLVSEPYRVLALARFWNLVTYFYPYKTLMDTPWEQVLGRMLPRFIEADGPGDYGRQLNALVVMVNDSHAELRYEGVTTTKGRVYRGMPLSLREIDGSLIVTHVESVLLPGQMIRKGDRILSIDGVSNDSLLRPGRFPIPASNSRSYYRDAMLRLERRPDTVVSLRVERDGAIRDLKIPLFPPSVLEREMDGDSLQFLPHVYLREDIGYLVPSRIAVSDMKAAMSRYRRCKGLVFDLRSYPGLSWHIIMRELGEKRRPFVRFDLPDYSSPGTFGFDSYRYCGRIFSAFRPYRGRVAILVDERTQSRAEFTAMALRTFSGAKIIGSQTGGTDGETSDIALPGGYHTHLTMLGVAYPDGGQTQRRGVHIDIPCNNTAADYRDGTDALVTRAIRYIDSGK